MKIHFYTIGVYGSSEREFFDKLAAHRIDTFCDIRIRRAVRGADYAFVNSKKLQDKLEHLNINYHYEPALAPTLEIKKLQEDEDKQQHVQRRKREELGATFISAYTKKILAGFDMENFIDHLEKKGVRKVVFFCVEKSPEACHRSLVMSKIRDLYPNAHITHL